MAQKSKNKSKLTKNQIFILKVVIVFIIAAAFAFAFIFKDPIMNLLSGTNKNKKTANIVRGTNDLRVHFLDVQQGDSIFIELPDGKVMLIDSGDRSNDRANFICNYIEGLSYGQIDYLLATHTDADHIGNMVKIFERFEIKNAYVPYVEDLTRFSQTYNNFIAAIENEKYMEGVEEKSCRKIYSEQGEKITSTDENSSFFLGFISPRGISEAEGEYAALNKVPPQKPTAKTINDASAVLYLEYMAKTMLFTGDINASVEERLVSYDKNGFFNGIFGQYSVDLENIDLLKVAHHGSSGSSSQVFVDYVKPSYAVISVGTNTYGHPQAEIISRFVAASATVMRTDVGGTVIADIYADQSKPLTVYYESEGKPETLSYKINIVCFYQKKSDEFFIN